MVITKKTGYEFVCPECEFVDMCNTEDGAKRALDLHMRVVHRKYKAML